jgi:alkylation response protein AidB-like acyl-CoA dehydrogenase
MDVEDLTEEQRMLHQATTEFIEAQLPLEAGRALHGDPVGYPRKWFAGTAELGWYSMLIAEAYGGGSVTGHGLLDLTMIADSVGRYLQPGPFLTMNVVGAAISDVGTAAQRAAVLPQIVSGELAITWAPFDSAGRWDLGAGLRATLDGPDIVLSGSRGFVTDAVSAGSVLLVCELDGTPAQVLVDATTTGVGVEPLSCFDVTRRIGELTFDDVRIPADALLGSSTDGTAEQLERQLQIAVVLACAETVGALDAMFTMTVEYSKDRIAFGRPIGSFQALKHAMADQLLQLESCKAATAEAAIAVDAGSAEAAEIVSMAAAYVDEYASEIAQQSLQVHGGIGFTWEHDLHLFMRRIRVNTSMWCDKAWHYERLCEVCAL